jgi:CheY-like chemotaxis protein
MNLGINAWHAMEGRPGLIDVTLDVVEDDRGLAGPRASRCVRLSVRDTGQGMSPATQARIFEPFFTTKAPGEGTGLGLSTVHGIMKSCHGEISVSSQIGAGTTFELYFPAIDVGAPDVGVRETPVPRGRGQHILFIDDEASLVAWSAEALERLGYRVTGQTSAVDAIAAVAEDARRFDLVVTDLTMPAMTGFELAERIGAVRPDLPVVFMSGNIAAMAAESVQRYGIDAFVLKPVSFKSLAQAVHRVLQSEGED